MYANDRLRCMPTTGYDVCQRQVAIYANDRVRFMRTTGTANESGRRQDGSFIQPQNDGGLATSRYSIIK